jgi:predicted patatin/cPLA2 family phospholipase
MNNSGTVNMGLVLEGGGLRGNYTAGVLDVFLEKGIVFPYVIGVSAGSGMGSSYVSGQKERNLEILQRFHGDPRYLSFRNLILTGSLFGMKFVFNDIPRKYHPFDWKTFIESPIRFTAVATDCDTGEPVYFEKNSKMTQDDFFATLMASSSMPYTSRILTYKGGKYLDGAITDALPLKKTVSEGFTRNVVVLTNPAGFRKKEEPHPPNGLLYFGRKKLIDALKLRITRYNQSLEHVEAEEKAGNVIVIRPSEDLHVSRIEEDKEKLLRLYALGKSDAEKVIAEDGKFLCA